MCDLFLVVKDVEIASYANDNMPYIVVDNTDQVTSDLQNASASLFNSPDKCHLLIHESWKKKKKKKKIACNIKGNSKCGRLLVINNL